MDRVGPCTFAREHSKVLIVIFWIPDPELNLFFTGFRTEFKPTRLSMAPPTLLLFLYATQYKLLSRPEIIVALVTGEFRLERRLH